MSDCGVCVGAFDGEPSEFVDQRIVAKARKPHRCSECNGVIEVGKSYHVASGKGDGEFWSFKTCMICREIRAAFSCEGETFGGIFWEEMEYCFEALNTSCFDKLTTPEAKAELQRRWMKWKGLAA